MKGCNETVEHLKNSGFLHSASDGMVSHLAKQVQRMELKAGETVFNRGDLGNSMYIVAEGSVRVHENNLVLKRLSRGEIFGEIGALASESRTASVTADSDSILLKIEQDDLYEGLVNHPEAARSVIQALCEKERQIIHDETEYAVKASQLEKELEIAHNIQRSFLPSDVPSINGFEFYPYLKPAREVAGDFYDFFDIPCKGSVGFVVGDVCDKGIGAALFMTLFRTLLHSTAQFQDCNGLVNSDDGIENLLKNSVSFTNRYVSLTHGHSNMFSTVFIGLLDPVDGTLIYINAGHEPACIVNQNGIRQQLEPTGPVVGMFMEADYQVNKTTLNHDELFIAYTDGVTEAKNIENQMYSDDRLTNIMQRSPKTGAEMLSSILKDIDKFVGNREQYDDTTILVIERK
ncbi:MAG: SpoIIE family protein phosphatase [Thioalkalispiraceae bacterium]|jgi:serine phosphatase RsbU (regulator of sigma subunit)